MLLIQIIYLCDYHRGSGIELHLSIFLILSSESLACHRRSKSEIHLSVGSWVAWVYHSLHYLHVMGKKYYLSRTVYSYNIIIFLIFINYCTVIVLECRLVPRFFICKKKGCWYPLLAYVNTSSKNQELSTFHKAEKKAIAKILVNLNLAVR